MSVSLSGVSVEIFEVGFRLESLAFRDELIADDEFERGVNRFMLSSNVPNELNIFVERLFSDEIVC